MDEVIRGETESDGIDGLIRRDTGEPSLSAMGGHSDKVAICNENLYQNPTRWHSDLRLAGSKTVKK